MVGIDFKKRFVISLVLLTLSLSLFVLVSWSWFTQLIEDNKTYQFGHVEVELDAYFYSEDISDVCVSKATGIYNSSEVLLYTRTGSTTFVDGSNNLYSLDESGNLVDSSLIIVISTNSLLDSEEELDRILYFDASSNLLNRNDIIVYTYQPAYSNYVDAYLHEYELDGGNLIDSETEAIIIPSSHIFSSKSLLNDFINSAYYLNGRSYCNEANEYEIGLGVTKPGVFYINIDSNSSIYFLENFRLNIVVKSSVDTYFRIRIYEQLTLSYENYEDTITELSILEADFMPFNYNLTNWFDNRSIDNSMYYKYPVKRVSAIAPMIIPLIPAFESGVNFPVYDTGYSMQIAFSLEAVQAFGGPEYVWGHEAPPWDFYGNLVQKNDPETIVVEASRIFGSKISFQFYLNSLLYQGLDDHLYDYNDVLQYTYDDINDYYTKDNIVYIIDNNGDLVKLSALSDVVVASEYIFASRTAMDNHIASLFYTAPNGNLLNFEDLIIYTKNPNNDYTDGLNNYFIMVIIVS